MSLHSKFYPFLLQQLSENIQLSTSTSTASDDFIPYQQINDDSCPTTQPFNSTIQMQTFHTPLNITSHQQRCTNIQESITSLILSNRLLELINFTEFFKQRRIKLGCTQAEVGASLGQWNKGIDFSQTTICRFENLQLSFENACRLKQLIQVWLEQPEQKIHRQTGRKSISGNRRTTINALQREVLERHFIVQKKPSSLELATISKCINLEKKVVRVWFCNRRQRERTIQNSVFLQYNVLRYRNAIQIVKNQLFSK